MLIPLTTVLQGRCPTFQRQAGCQRRKACQADTEEGPGGGQAYYDRIPVGRYGERSEVAVAALFLASPDSSFVSGHILNVDGGFAAAELILEDDALTATSAGNEPGNDVCCPAKGPAT